MTIQVTPGGGVHRFTIEQYCKVLETGIFDGERVELLDGEIIVMSPINNPHRGIVSRLMRKLNASLAEKYTYANQSSIDIPDHSQPEPDIVIAEFRDDDYVNQAIEPKDVYLIIEVADSTIQIDRRKKAPIYARAGIPEYWIANLRELQIEVFKELANGDYEIKAVYKVGTVVTCEEIGFTLSVDDLFKYLKKESSD